MDILLLAVLIAWLPVAAALALLVGRSVLDAERRERRLRVIHKPRPGHPAPVVTITSAPRHPHRVHAHSGHHLHDHHQDRRVAS